MTSPDTERFSAIDGLRAFAILPVIAAHSHVAWMHGGGVGVDVFFGISGFLITYLLLKESRANRRVDLRNFWLRRALRLLPALLVLVLVVVTLALLVPGNDYLQRSLTATPAILLYYANWLIVAQQGPALGWFGPLWSLSVEEQFYLVWPLIIMLTLRVRRSLRAVAAIAAVVGGTAAVVRAVTFDGTNLYRTFGTDFRVDMLLAGVLLAVALRAGLRDVIRQVSRLLVVPAVGYLAVIWVIVPEFNASGAEFANRLYYTAGLPLVALSTVSILGFLVTHGDSRLAVFLSTRPLAYTGRISYGMYLWHYPVIMVILSTVQLPPTIVFLGALVGTYAAATVSWFAVERPLTQRFHRRLRARRPLPQPGRVLVQDLRT